ncbi:MAG: rifampicin phosphotransferase [Solirubrobacteraceae bacterium]|jgi:pyruvate,water dikinase|nr:rifampicin phosphotransferase [Solirubrobacteraceae bacterium]
MDIAPVAWDPTHCPGLATKHWSTDNVGEAAPGVLTPLTFSLWVELGEKATRGAAYAIGGFTKQESLVPAAAEERFVRAFFGRVAMQAEFLAILGDRLPGTTGEEMIEGIFGRVAEDIDYRPTKRRYPAVALRLPRTFVTMPKEIKRLAAVVDPWWRQRVATLDTLDRDAAQALIAEGVRHFDRALYVQTLSVVGVMSPLFEALTKVIETTGIGDAGTLSGTGGAEMAIVADIFAASRGRLELDEVIRRHGFHGPLEGETLSRVWREDRSPLEKMVRAYEGKPDDADPKLREPAARAEIARMQGEILAALPALQRPAVKRLLRLAADRLPLRGYAKRSFLQAIDVTRGAARRYGEHLVADGVLDDPDDVFFFTETELARPLPDGAKDLVARRRERRELFQTLTFPGSWTGELVPDLRSDRAASEETTLTGIGVSAGVVEGLVRVVEDPAFTDVEDDEILVAPTTDPSWASIMFVSAALVVDIGGALSHAAVVARELGIPCVVNTRTGTSVLRTGDRVRVDGKAGTVEVLERAS